MVMGENTKQRIGEGGFVVEKKRIRSKIIGID